MFAFLLIKVKKIRVRTLEIAPRFTVLEVVEVIGTSRPLRSSVAHANGPVNSRGTAGRHTNTI